MWLALGVTGCLFGSNARDNRNPDRLAEMMRLVHEVGELPPFPATATELWVQTEGNMFTRTFVGRYCDTPEAVDAWLKGAARLTEPLQAGGYADYDGEEQWRTTLWRSGSGACVDFQVSWS